MDTQSKYRIVADVISLCDENDRLREQVRTIEAAEREQRDVTATASLSSALMPGRRLEVPLIATSV